jgi:hypothetical protein
MSSAICFNLSIRRAVSISFRFWGAVRANSNAVLLPIPLDAPVMTIVFPSRRLALADDIVDVRDKWRVTVGYTDTACCRRLCATLVASVENGGRCDTDGRTPSRMSSDIGVEMTRVSIPKFLKVYRAINSRHLYAGLSGTLNNRHKTLTDVAVWLLTGQYSGDDLDSLLQPQLLHIAPQYTKFFCGL